VALPAYAPASPQSKQGGKRIEPLQILGRPGLVQLALVLKSIAPSWLVAAIRLIIPKTMDRLELLQAASDAIGFQRPEAVRAAIKLGLFKQLAAQPGMTSSELVEHLGLKPNSTGRLLAILQALEYICVANDRYRLTPLGWKVMDGRLQALHTVSDLTAPAWGRLPDLLRTGEADPEMYLFEASDEVVSSYFVLASELLRPVVAELVDRLAGRLPVHLWQHVILGEVSLPLAAELLRRQPTLQVTVAALKQHAHLLEPLLERYPLPAGSAAPAMALSMNGDPLEDIWCGDELPVLNFVVLYRKAAYFGYGSKYINMAWEVLAPGGAIIMIEPTSDAVTGSVPFLPLLSMMDGLIGGEEAPELLSSRQIAANLQAVGFRTERFLCSEGIWVVIGWKPA
jgi:hypothetical protein